jgi:hypothetical protein
MPRWGWIALGAVMLMAAFYFTLDAYGDSRYEAGQEKADAAWVKANQKANDKLMADVAKARSKAEKEAATRAIKYNEQAIIEQGKIEAAVKDGSSPFNVLFPTEGK